MDNKGSNEMMQRAELHRKIWSIADNVRGAVDGWDFKLECTQNLGQIIWKSRKFKKRNVRVYRNMV